MIRRAVDRSRRTRRLPVSEVLLRAVRPRPSRRLQVIKVAPLRRADAAGTLKVRHPRQAADVFLSMFLGDGHIRGLLMLDMPDARENRTLLKEAVRVFMAAYAPGA